MLLFKLQPLNKHLKSILLILPLLIGQASQAQVLSPDSIDRLVERTLKTFDVPGIALAIVKDDKIVYAKGYGVSSLATKKRWMKTLCLA